MALSTLDNTSKTKSTVMENTLGKTVANTKAPGKTISWMATASTPGFKTAENMKATIKTTKNMVKASTHGLMDVNMMVNGKTESNTAMASTYQKRANKDRASGKTVKEKNG